MLHVICVNAPDYLGRGTEYVLRLDQAIRKNLDVRHQFHVIDTVIAEGWWNKLQMFEPGRFEGRCLYFDLDTVILGSINEIASYDGPFAMLSDFYHPERLASGIMAWDAKEGYDIWDHWAGSRKPQFMAGGDQAWIGFKQPNADRLQDLYPGQIVSFKADCLEGIPKAARVVCFHGHPRPHTLHDLMKHW